MNNDKNENNSFTLDDILNNLAAKHDPTSNGMVFCDICNDSISLDDISWDTRGKSIVDVDNGIFWVCDKCLAKIVHDHLEEINNWKRPDGSLRENETEK